MFSMLKNGVKSIMPVLYAVIGGVEKFAIAQVLGQPHLPGDLPLDGSVAVSLVRGDRSDLCHSDSFAALAAAAPDDLRSITVGCGGFGHPLWHSFPVLEKLVPMLGDAAQQGCGSVIDPSPR